MTQAQTPPAEQRDLRFFPVAHRPKTLTPEQVRFYNANGYLKPFRVFSDEQAAQHRATLDRLLAEIAAANDGRDAYSINGYQKQCRSIYDIATHPPILDLVEDIIGPNFVCWGTHFFVKLPGDPKSVPWHQDASYWPLTPSKTVTVWLAIDDADRDNGAMKVIPGTHDKGHLEFDLAKPGEQVVLNQRVRNAESHGEPVYFELKAGEMSLHADMLVHGSDPNLSSRRRAGFTMRYASTDVRSLNPSWRTGSILCRGEDPNDHWVHLPRPNAESTAPMEWQIKTG